MSVVIGSPVQAFGTAIYQRLNGDATLLALATGGVHASMPQSERTERPYVVVASREFRDDGIAGGMQREGGRLAVTVDVFSDFHGPDETEQIQSRVKVLLQRYDLTVTGYVLYSGSVALESELVFSDFDPNMPQRSGYHGVQRWVGLVEEAAP